MATTKPKAKARNGKGRKRGNSRVKHAPEVVLEELIHPDKLIGDFNEDLDASAKHKKRREVPPIPDEETWRDEEHRYSVSRLFDSWSSFVEAAVQFNVSNYTYAYLFARARHYFYSYGRKPSMRSWENPPSVTYILFRYKKWNDFLESAGIPTDTPWTDEMLIKLLQQAYKELGKPPTTLDLSKPPLRSYIPSFMVFCNHFGSEEVDEEGNREWKLASWSDVLEKAGIPAPPKRETVSFTDEELIEYVQRLAKRLKRVPRPKDIDFLHQRNLELRQEDIKAGRDPNKKHPHVPSLSAYYNGGRFPKWRDVVYAAGMVNEWVNEVHFPDPALDSRSDFVLESIKKATEMLDGVHVPTLQQYTDLRKHDKSLASFYLIKHLFGTYGQAIKTFLAGQEDEYAPPLRKNSRYKDDE